MLDDSHPLTIEIDSLRSAVARFQDEAHSASVKLQRFSFDTSTTQDRLVHLERENELLRHEISNLRANPHPDTLSESHPAVQQSAQLTLALRRLSDKLTITEEALLTRTTELVSATHEATKCRAAMEGAYALSAQMRGREEEAKIRERELEMQLRKAREEAKMSDIVVKEYADLVRSLDAKSRNPSGTSNDQLADGLSEGKLGLQRLFNDFTTEVETLSARVTHLQGQIVDAEKRVEAERKAGETERLLLAQTQHELEKLKLEDKSAAKMVSRYMQFSQTSTNTLQNSLSTLKTRHATTIDTLTAQITTLTHQLHVADATSDKLRTTLDELGGDIMREAFGRRREIALRLRLVTREQILNDGLERLVRRVSEALDRSPEHAAVLQKILGDARGLLASINGEEFSDGTEGSLARVIAAESAVRGLVEELRVETTKRMQIETRRSGGMINGHVNGHPQHNGALRVEEREKGLPEVPPPSLPASLPTSPKPRSPAPGSPSPVPVSALGSSPSRLEPTPPASVPILVPPPHASLTLAVQDDTSPRSGFASPTSPILGTEEISVPNPKSISSVSSVVSPEELQLPELEPILSTAMEEISQAPVAGSSASVEPIAGDDAIAVPAEEISQAEIAQPIASSSTSVEPPAGEDKVQVATSGASSTHPFIEDTTSPSDLHVLQVGDVSTSHSANAEPEDAAHIHADSDVSHTQDSESSDTLHTAPDVPVLRVVDSTTSSSSVSPNMVRFDANQIQDFETSTTYQTARASSSLSPNIAHAEAEAEDGSDVPQTQISERTPVSDPAPASPYLSPDITPPSIPDVQTVEPDSPHPLLAELTRISQRYSDIQRSFRDCHLSLEELKKSTSSSLAHIQIALDRLDDYTEDARVELEIRITDEELLTQGYETMLSVPGALSTSASGRGHVRNSSQDSIAPTPTLGELEVQIQAFTASAEKAQQVFEKKLADVQHDIARLKQVVHDPNSSLSLSPEPVAESEPEPPTQNTGWGSWTRMIPSSSRPSSPVPTSPPTFGNVMTTPRLRHASSIQRLKQQQQQQQALGREDPFAGLGLKVAMPSRVVSLSHGHSPTSPQGGQRNRTVSLLGLGGGMGMTRSASGSFGSPSGKSMSRSSSHNFTSDRLEDSDGEVE
ncbi:hypothetical protein Moror_12254 [Moniliophthora roreri MCA 2997]|uniref:Uncharacterized protein n=1 Tax=Moniliophthora roreri (strain MCA 2997) TaxID=1381753 RepID=V2WQL2_MONRO|nr:hypothetical protein Moror_12254 [Moniliophthora roreri MCA 2997]